jgi:hypothetical protein
MVRSISVSLVVTLLCTPVTGRGEEHVVTRAQIQARLLEASAGRQQALRAVDAALSTPVALAAAGRFGVRTADLRARAAALSDAELRELKSRAEALTSDPVSGANPVLVIFAVIGLAAVLLILLVVVACSGGCYD